MLLFVTGKGVFVFHFHALLRALWNVPVLNFNMSAFQFAFPVAFERFFCFVTEQSIAPLFTFTKVRETSAIDYLFQCILGAGILSNLKRG